MVKERRSDYSGDAAAARRIARQMAWLSTIIGILYFLRMIGKLAIDGSIHSISSPPLQMLSAVFGILWDIILVVLFVALRRLFQGPKAIYADMAAVFMLLLGATSSVNWFVQLTTVAKIREAADPAILALVDIHDHTSIMFAIEHLAWGVFYGLALLFAAVLFGGSRRENWIRWLFVAGGVLSILHVVGIVFPVDILLDLGYLAPSVLLPPATWLLALWLRE